MKIVIEPCSQVNRIVLKNGESKNIEYFIEFYWHLYKIQDICKYRVFFERVINLTKKVHTTVGFCSGIIISFLLYNNNLSRNIASFLVLTFGSFLGSIIPDVDNRRSYIGHKAKAISKTINKHGGHRGITHSILGLAILILLLFGIGSSMNLIDYLYFKDFCFGIAVGYVSHLAFDIINISGIPLFYPIKKRFCLFKLRSDKYQNLISIFCTIVTMLILIYISYQNKLN